jgi:glycosyltransferase involved in cell wall biosynthesis
VNDESSLQPRVSIGLPVYNGDNYLREALESIVGQTYPNLEIVISDNASTDATGAICQEFAARDSRIAYFRQETNLGASANHDFVLKSSTGPLFRLAAHDDVLAPSLIEECVKGLLRNPRAVLAFPRVLRIDANGRTVEEIDKHFESMSSSSPVRRFGLSACRPSWATHVFGLMRRDAIGDKEILGKYPGADRTFLAAMALEGPWVFIDQPLFYRRDHASNSNKTFVNDWRGRLWFDPAMQLNPVSFPQWRRLAELGRVIRRSGLGLPSQFGAFLQLVRWCVTPVYRPRFVKLFRDPVLVIFRLITAARERRPITSTIGDKDPA